MWRCWIALFFPDSVSPSSAIGSVPLLDDDRVTLLDVDGRDLSDAYGWATARSRVITFADDARPLWRVVGRYARILGETCPKVASRSVV